MTAVRRMYKSASNANPTHASTTSTSMIARSLLTIHLPTQSVAVLWGESMSRLFMRRVGELDVGIGCISDLSQHQYCAAEFCGPDRSVSSAWSAELLPGGSRYKRLFSDMYLLRSIAVFPHWSWAVLQSMTMTGFCTIETNAETPTNQAQLLCRGLSSAAYWWLQPLVIPLPSGDDRQAWPSIHPDGSSIVCCAAARTR